MIYKIQKEYSLHDYLFFFIYLNIKKSLVLDVSSKAMKSVDWTTEYRTKSKEHDPHFSPRISEFIVLSQIILLSVLLSKRKTKRYLYIYNQVYNNIPLTIKIKLLIGPLEWVQSLFSNWIN